MTNLSYLKSIALEFVLVLLCSVAFSMVGFNGFFIEDSLHNVPLTTVLSAVLLVVLYVTVLRRERLVMGIVCYVALIAVLVAAGIFTSTGEQAAFVDAEGSHLYYVLVVAASVTLCFLLSRTLGGCVAWLVLSVFLCSVVQAFYTANEVLFSLLVLCGSLALVICKNFRLGLLKADSARKVSFASNAVCTVAPVLAAGGIAVALWVLIIAPLNPGTLQIKLVTDYRSLPIEYVKGTADIDPITNTDMTTNQLVDGARYTTDDLLTGDSDTEVDATSMSAQQLNGAHGGGGATGSKDALDDSSLDKKYDAMSYSMTFPYVIILILIALAIVAAIVVFFLLRRKRRETKLISLLEQTPREQVIGIYHFLMVRLARLGFKVPDGLTLPEYARNQARRMDALTADTKVPFEDITATYVSVVYGNREPTEDEIVPFVAYYQGFWKAARSYLGNFKYFFKSFRL